MDLHRASREDLRATFEGAPTQVISGSIDDGLTWPIACTRISPTQVEFRIAGPDADPGGATVLPLGSTAILLRAADGPETPVRLADVVNVY